MSGRCELAAREVLSADVCRELVGAIVCWVHRLQQAMRQDASRFIRKRCCDKGLCDRDGGFINRCRCGGWCEEGGITGFFASRRGARCRSPVCDRREWAAAVTNFPLLTNYG